VKILVYGAGNIGRLYAARLKDAGHDVFILARGKRLQEIRDRGILLREFYTGKQTTTHVESVERLHPEDVYDLVLVVLPRQCVSQVLPILAENNHTPSVMFFGNNAAGADAMIQALDRERVLLGFPGAAGISVDDYIRYLILSPREQLTTIGEVDGVRSKRIDEIANALRTSGFPVSISANMDAWLKTHVAEISPTANALYMAGGDIEQLVHNRDVLVMLLRAIREGYRVLLALGIPITPPIHNVFRWIPESLLLVLMKRRLGDKAMTIKIGHASAARSEMRAVADEFSGLVRRAGVETPAIDTLRRHLSDVEPSVEGK
jgi:2-dehydropantoate 2-reductase